MLQDPGRDAAGEGSLLLQPVSNLFLQVAFLAFSLPCPKGPNAVSASRQTNRLHPWVLQQEVIGVERLWKLFADLCCKGVSCTSEQWASRDLTPSGLSVCSRSTISWLNPLLLLLQATHNTVSETHFRTRGGSCSCFPPSLLPRDFAGWPQGPWWYPLLWADVWCCSVGSHLLAVLLRTWELVLKACWEASRAVAGSQLVWCISQIKGEKELPAALEEDQRGDVEAGGKPTEKVSQELCPQLTWPVKFC